MAKTTAWRSHCQFTLLPFYFAVNVIRQMAVVPLFSKIDLNKLWRLDVQNDEAVIFAKFGKEICSILLKL